MMPRQLRSVMSSHAGSLRAALSRAALTLALLLPLVIVHTANARGTVSAMRFLRPSGETSIGEAFTIDSSALRTALRMGSVTITDFPGVGAETLMLDLKHAHSAIDSGTICVAQTDQGVVRVATPDVVCFRGRVRGEPGSMVFLARMNCQLLISITRESGVRYIFGPDKLSDDPTRHLLCKETDLLASSPFTPFNCINDDIQQPKSLPLVDELLANYRAAHSPGKTSAQVMGTTGLLQTDIAVEADTAFYAATGRTLASSLGYIGAMFSMASVYYEDETNITFHLTWIKVWTTSDPYNVKGNAYALPDTVRSYWQRHYDTVQRDLAHVLTSIGYGGGGYGYFSLCDKAYSYSVSSPQTGHTYPTFAWTYDSYTLAHEIGHNFSLPHSHTCWWNPPLDTCYTKHDTLYGLSQGDACDTLPIEPRRSPGSIMSYCQNTNYKISGDFGQYKTELTFTPKGDSVLRANAEKTACIMPPTDPTVILTDPRGSETYPSDTTIQIHWTYANVATIALDYSADSAHTWAPIISGLPANQLQYDWKLPRLGSTEMFVRVRSEVAPIVSDTSLLFFTIVNQGVATQSIPADNIRLYPNPAQGVTILSSATAIGRVRVEVFDELGRSLAAFSGALMPSSGMPINVGSLKAGKYFVRVSRSAEFGRPAFLMTLPLIHTQ